jgi:hypothetical protein
MKYNPIFPLNPFAGEMIKKVFKLDTNLTINKVNNYTLKGSSVTSQVNVRVFINKIVPD